ncbi:MAG: DUF2059 domain-containing protein [Acidobacteriota bacterium]|nr:DUF2059 domain-containing protein [Acidobacteriota bacterium]
MKRSTLTLLALGALLSWSAVMPAAAQESHPSNPTPTNAAAATPAREADIRKLMELSGSANIGMQVMNQMKAALQQSMKAPDGFWDRFMKEVDPKELVDRIVPIYSRHFSEEDIQGMIAFYQTPLGRKLVTVMPQIAAESMVSGQEWGQQVAQRALAKLQKEPDKKP